MKFQSTTTNKGEKVIFRANVIAFILACHQTSTSNTISGIVVDSSRKAIHGARITLKNSGIATGTNASGIWEIQTPVSSALKMRDVEIFKNNQLQLRNGRLELCLSGYDLTGKSFTSNSKYTPVSGPVEARKTFAETDTVIVSLDNASLARVSITSPLDTIIIDASSKSRIPWNDKITYFQFTDRRDGQVYKATKIGDQIWMAENLNYRNSIGKSDTTGRAYQYLVDSTIKYGRLYDWIEATARQGDATTPTAEIQGICPQGWHIPTEFEWSILSDTSSISGLKLKSVYGWRTRSNETKYIGNDSLGFRALPGGGGNMTYKSFGGISYAGGFWSSTKPSTCGGWVMEYGLYSSDSSFSKSCGSYYNLSSIRCVANMTTTD